MKATPLKKIAQLMHLTTDADCIISGVSADSRLTVPGDLFFALPGAQSDGHFFIPEAAAKGARAAVVRRDYSESCSGMPLLHCDDVLESLQLLGKLYLRLGNAKIIAVTGSIGKTTTKDFLSTLLKCKYKISSSPGNSNSQIGLPLAILNNVSLDEDLLIFEMGMTHRHQISKLIEIAPPTVALITTIALVHACNFDSIDEIAQAKAELFSHPNTDLGIYPKECDIKNTLSRSGPCRKLSFSTNTSNADYVLESLGEEMIVKSSNADFVRLPLLTLLGNHNRHNFLAAAIAARHFGVSWEEIGERMSSLTLPERRLQIIEKFDAVFVNDSYNASEISLKAALSSLPKPKALGKKIAVIGEMLELGKFSHQCHLEVGEYALKYVDSMFCLGQECSPIYECWQKAGRPVYWTQERQSLVAALRAQLQPNDVVLLKGSRAKGLWKILDEL